MSLLQMSISGAVLIAAILIVRAVAINRLPKVTFLILWEIAILRLLVPFSFSSSVSVYSLFRDSRAATVLEERLSSGNDAEAEASEEGGETGLVQDSLSGENMEATVTAGTGATGDVTTANAGAGETVNSGTADAGVNGMLDAATENVAADETLNAATAAAGTDETLNSVTADTGVNGTLNAAAANADGALDAGSESAASGILSGANRTAAAVYAFLSAVSVLTLVWFAGVLACAAFFIITYVRSRRKFSFSTPVQNAYTKRWLSQHEQRRTVSIRQTDLISAPLTYGIVRPVILMPARTDWEDARHLDYIFAHEYNHIRHFDTLKKLICVLALCLHWFNPFVWVLYFLYNRDIELACDESVVRGFGESSRREYSLMLINMEAKKSGLLPLCNHFSKNSIEERIRAIMKTKKMTVSIIALSVAIVVVIAALFATSANDDAESPQTTETDDTGSAGTDETLADAGAAQDGAGSGTEASENSDEGTAGTENAGTEDAGADTGAQQADAGTAGTEDADPNADETSALSVTGSVVSKEENAALYEQVRQLLSQRDYLESEMCGGAAIDQNTTITVDGVTYCLVTEEGITSFGDYEALAEEIYTEDYVEQLFMPQYSGDFTEADGKLYMVNADAGFVSIDEDSICIYQQGSTDGVYIVTADTDTGIISLGSTTRIFVIQVNEEKPYGLEIRDEIQFFDSTLEKASPVAQEENASLYEQLLQLINQRDLLETEMNLGGEIDQNTTATVDGDSYALVTREGIHSFSDYEALAAEVYMESYVSRIFTPVYSGLYAEVSGSLYRVMADGFAQTLDEEAGISVWQASASDGVYIVIGYTAADDAGSRSTLIFIMQENAENTYGFEIRDVIQLS